MSNQVKDLYEKGKGTSRSERDAHFLFLMFQAGHRLQSLARPHLGNLEHSNWFAVAALLRAFDPTMVEIYSRSRNWESYREERRPTLRGFSSSSQSYKVKNVNRANPDLRKRWIVVERANSPKYGDL